MKRKLPENRKPSRPSSGDARRHPTTRKPSTRRASTPVRKQSAESGERLQKVLASAGVASRRECEELIREGRVEVDHKVVTELGTRVDPAKQEIRVDGEALKTAKLVYFAINKPTGVVATARDPAGRMRVGDLLPPNSPRVFCVGRLDIASEGLILMTNDGELANGLTHPRHGVEKIYQVKVAGQVEQEVLAKLHRGIHLAEGFAHAKHIKIKSRNKNSSMLEMVLDEGRNREVRRLLARVGHKVQQLKRIAVGPVRLGELPTGAVRQLERKEVEALERAVANGAKKSADESEQTRSARKPGKKLPQRPGSPNNEPKKRTVIG